MAGVALDPSHAGVDVALAGDLEPQLVVFDWSVGVVQPGELRVGEDRVGRSQPVHPPTTVTTTLPFGWPRSTYRSASGASPNG